MIKIDMVKSLNLDKEIKAELDCEKRVFVIYKNKNYIYFDVAKRLSLEGMKLLDSEGKKITIHDLELKYEDNEKIIYNIENIYVGTYIEEELDKVKEVSVKIFLKSNRTFVNKNISFTLEDGINIYFNKSQIRISNFLGKESDINFTLLRIMEFLAIILGEFPIIEYFKFRLEDETIITKYVKITGYTITAIDFTNIAKALVNLDNIRVEKLKDMYSKYYDLIGKDDIQLRHFFTSQSNSSLYSDYRLTYLLQGLEGFANLNFSDKITVFLNKRLENAKSKMKNNKSKIEDDELEMAMCDIYGLIENKGYSNKLKKRIKGMFKSVQKKHDFNAILDFLLDEDEFISNLFSSECNTTKENKYYINKDKLIKYSLNERNRISHALKKCGNERYFTLNDRIFYLKKYSVMFRYLVLKVIGATFEQEILDNITNEYNKNT